MTFLSSSRRFQQSSFESSFEESPPVLVSSYRLISRLALPIGGLLLMSGLLAYILYFMDPEETPQQIPVIKADPGPVRVKPDNPGGSSVPHQDKLVYSRLESTKTPEETPRLMPLPEDPLESLEESGALFQEKAQEKTAELAKAPLYPEVAASSSMSSSEEAPLTKAMIQTPLPSLIKKSLPLKSAPMVSSKGLLKKEKSPLLMGAYKETPKKTDSTKIFKNMGVVLPLNKPAGSPVVISSKNGYRLQLSLSRSPDLLQKEFIKMSQRYPTLLQGYKANITPIKRTGQSAPLYALRIGPFSKDKLQKLGAELRHRKIKYTVINP